MFGVAGGATGTFGSTIEGKFGSTGGAFNVGRPLVGSIVISGLILVASRVGKPDSGVKAVGAAEAASLAIVFMALPRSKSANVAGSIVTASPKGPKKD